MPVTATRIGIILAPDPNNLFAKHEVFNPGVYFDRRRNILHVFPRAVSSPSRFSVSYDYISKILWFYSSLSSGLEGIRRVDAACSCPILAPETAEERFGVEDPRVSEIYINGARRLVMTYTAVESVSPEFRFRCGVAVADARDVEEFRASKPFKRVGYVNVPYTKNAFYVQCGEKVYFVFRSFSYSGNYGEPTIKIVEVGEVHGPKDLLTVDATKAVTLLKPREKWELLRVGAGAPPVKVDKLLLWIYHGVALEGVGQVYRVGVFATLANEPTRLIAKLPYPIMEPSEPWEKWLDVPYVVFPTGAFIFDDKLIIVYGACDTVVAAAYVDISELLSELDKYSVE